MATQLIADTLRSTRSKDKLVIIGFIYTLNKSTELEHWVCEKRGQCKARVTIGDGLVIVKPNCIKDIQDSHTHGPDVPRIDMLKGYNRMKERANENLEESTRSIFSNGVATFGDSSLIKLSKTDSIKRTIRKHKNGLESFGNPAHASEIQILDKYKVTPKGETFLQFDSVVGDSNRIIMFARPKVLLILKTSESWYADGTFKVAPQQFYQLYTIHAEKDGYIFPCVYVLVTGKTELIYNRMLGKLLELEPALNPSYLMLDFERAAINAFEEAFVAVVSGCFFHFSQNAYRKIQSLGLTSRYIEDPGFALYMKMLPVLPLFRRIKYVIILIYLCRIFRKLQ